MHNPRLDPTALDSPPRNRDGTQRGPHSDAARERLEQIKTVAARLFYERGYHGADLREIAQEVGMHPSTFYHYIAEKQQLLYLILSDGLRAMLEEFNQRVAPIEDPLAALAEAMRMH